MSEKELTDIEKGYKPCREGYQPTDNTERGYQPTDINPQGGHQPERDQIDAPTPTPPSED